MVVLFPAPLGPKKPKISPFFTLKEIWLTAFRGPKFLYKSSTEIISEEEKKIYEKLFEELDDQEEVKDIVITDAPVEEKQEEVEAPVVEVIEAVDQPIAEVEKPEEAIAVEAKPEVAAPVTPSRFVSPKDTEAGKKRGLTVVGKMDLGEEKKPKPQVKRLPVTQKASDGKPETTESSSDAIKKKKRPKTKKKTTTTEVTPEETPVAKKRKRVKKFEIDEKDVKAAIKKTMLSMDDTATTNRASSRKKKRREREAEEERLEELRT